MSMSYQEAYELIIKIRKNLLTNELFTLEQPIEKGIVLDALYVLEQEIKDMEHKAFLEKRWNEITNNKKLTMP